jgi:hypothetical protein
MGKCLAQEYGNVTVEWMDWLTRSSAAQVETITVGETEGFRDGVTEGKFDAGKQVPGLGSVPGSFLCKLSSNKQNKQCMRYIQHI